MSLNSDEELVRLPWRTRCARTPTADSCRPAVSKADEVGSPSQLRSSSLPWLRRRQDLNLQFLAEAVSCPLRDSRPPHYRIMRRRHQPRRASRAPQGSARATSAIYTAITGRHRWTPCSAELQGMRRRQIYWNNQIDSLKNMRFSAAFYGYALG